MTRRVNVLNGENWISDVQALIRMEVGAGDPPDPSAPNTPAGGDPPPNAAGAEPPAPPAGATTQSEGSPPPSGAPDTSGAATSSAGDPPPAQDWRDRRIAQLTARLREAERRAQPATPGTPSGTPPVAPPAAPEDDQGRIAAAAEALVAQREFNNACNAAADEGRKAFSDFDSRVQSLVRTVDPQDRNAVQSYNNLVAAALETGKAHEILHRLGGDLNEASRLMSLPPVKMAVEVARLAATPVQPGTSAPKPIQPVGGRSAPHTEIDPGDPRSDNLSTREWMSRREAQLSRSRGNA